MKDFRLFDIYDFLMDEDFIRWVSTGGKAETEFWANWLMDNPDRYIVVAEARRILESFGPEAEAVPEEEKTAEIGKLLETIRGHQVQDTLVELRPARRIPKWVYAAAILFIAFASAVPFFFIKSSSKHLSYAYNEIIPPAGLIENVNSSRQLLDIRLPDGSVIVLSPDSRIAYANNFGRAETRDVYLSGEAFFTVTKQPSKPFRVFANEIVTKVLGTSFRVRSFEKDSAIQVVVRTGKVSVYSQSAVNSKEIASPSLGGIILTPNQELFYQKSVQKFHRLLMDNPVMVLPADQDKTLLYDEASLVKVFDQLSRNYGISIVFDTEVLKACTITADLRNVPFYEKLALICKAIGAKYEVIDGQVVIQANGCG